jgi:ankyrin repeat protein
LYAAAYYGDLRVVHLLLSAGANPNGRVDKGGPTPLMEAARRGDLMMVEALVRSGAGVNLTDEKNRRAIDYLKEHQRDVDRIATMLRQASKR